MSWFDTSGLTNLAKNALKEAQKTIDKALDIQDESSEEQDDESTTCDKNNALQSQGTPQKDDFFASWGLTVSAESDSTTPEPVVVTESPTKSVATNQTMWGSFAGSFFEQPKTETIVKPPKAKSMNVIADSQFGSHDDLFSKSQLVMSDSEGLEFKDAKKEVSKVDRRDSSKSNILSLMSSRHSSDSVEVLSQSLKTTPDSEVSVHSISQCSSGQKHNSESVEILPDSLISPSSIECLGFDSYTSDKTSSSSSMLSPGDFNDQKSTPIGEHTEKPDTADSVSLVADDDEDTMSYNSISECTAPTVLDTDEKPGIFPKLIKSEPRKGMERELMNLEHAVVPQKIFSETSSNDGSSDRTLNADNDSLILENTIEEQKKEMEREHEDIMMEKLSDSSSFYNVHVSSEMLRSESSAFVEVEKQQCNSYNSTSSHKDGSIKERTSPVSSESKSDLVKIGSDRTSGHTSGDEVETATSSDIEIIPSPNGDGFRNSPAKYGFKNGKFDGTTSPNLVDLVLGKSLATKIRGHTRELSETSIQSNTSDESQSSENERLMRRLCEMAEILDARENRLMEVSRSNAELTEYNAELKSQVESLMAKHEVGDINMITEDYTQRMSALEKKFQQAIREKDNFRKQLDSLKSKNSSDLENSLKEKEEVISQLHEEGEKLARQQLQHSNIIKKLRSKEKDNEQVIKGLRDKIAEQTAELDRVKRSMAAKEEVEVNQIEAVYRLTTTNKKLEADLMETKSALDDANQRLESSRASLEAARKELTELQRSTGELQRLKGQRPALEEKAHAAQAEAERLRAEVAQLRADKVNEEKRWVCREQSLRRELMEARETVAVLESRGASEGGQLDAGGVLAQLGQLQRAAVERDRTHARLLAELEKSLLKATEREKVSRSECAALTERLATAESLLQDVQSRLHAVSEQCSRAVDDCSAARDLLDRKSAELESTKSGYEAQVAELRRALLEAEHRLASEGAALDVERKRTAILQEQLSSRVERAEVSPPQSVASDSLSNSLWQSEEGGGWSYNASCVSAMQLEETLALARRRSGEARVLAATATRLRRDRAALQDTLAHAQATIDHTQNVQEQYDALLQMYGEKEEQLAELRLDLQDVTALYKAQLDELVALKQGGR